MEFETLYYWKIIAQDNHGSCPAADRELTEETIMDRSEALELMEPLIPDGNLRKHVYACEALMRALAGRLGGDAERWGLVGLLHDLDYVETESDPAMHSLKTAQILESKGVDAEIINAVKAHNDKAPRESQMAKAIYCADPTTGFIVACALVRPDKSLASTTVKSLKKRWKEKRFAAGASREQMATCQELGLTREEFLALALEAMQSISGILGLPGPPRPRREPLQAVQ